MKSLAAFVISLAAIAAVRSPAMPADANGNHEESRRRGVPDHAIPALDGPIRSGRKNGT